MKRFVKCFGALSRSRGIPRSTFHVPRKGFTLIEILVIVAIVGIFSGFLVINFSAGNKIRDVKNAALLVVDGIKRMQTMALAGEVIDGKVPLAYQASFSSGLSKFNLDYYISISESEPSSTATIETVELTNAKIELNVSPVNVIFYPPRANMEFRSGAPSLGHSIKIKVVHINDSSINYCVEVNDISG